MNKIAAFVAFFVTFTTLSAFSANKAPHFHLVDKYGYLKCWNTKTDQLAPSDEPCLKDLDIHTTDIWLAVASLEGLFGGGSYKMLCYQVDSKTLGQIYRAEDNHCTSDGVKYHMSDGTCYRDLYGGTIVNGTTLFSFSLAVTADHCDKVVKEEVIDGENISRIFYSRPWGPFSPDDQMGFLAAGLGKNGFVEVADRVVRNSEPQKVLLWDKGSGSNPRGK